VRAQIVTKEEVKPWCYVCGRVVDKVIVVRLPCPWCTTEAPIRMCLDCARKLVEELEKAIRDAA
jgi:Zn finger protein HypA/HybF involved in hydrogenase expression